MLSVKEGKYTFQYRDLEKNFNCGNIIIDDFLGSGDALDKNQGITYILLSDQKDFIIGYYNMEVGRFDQIEHTGDSTVYKPMGES